MNGDDWEWGYNEGVRIENDHILWYEKIGAVAFASGAACEQTFEHFLANGPWIDNVPPMIVAELTRAVRAQTKF